MTEMLSVIGVVRTPKRSQTMDHETNHQVKAKLVYAHRRDSHYLNRLTKYKASFFVTRIEMCYVAHFAYLITLSSSAIATMVRSIACSAII